MCGIYVREIQLVSVKCVLVSSVQIGGDLKMDMSGLLLSKCLPWQMWDMGSPKHCECVKIVL